APGEGLRRARHPSADRARRLGAPAHLAHAQCGREDDRGDDRLAGRRAGTAARVKRRFVVAGTDTDVGKTVFAAALTAALKGTYFKPVQAGLEPRTDTDTVRVLTGLGEDHFVAEAYQLRSALSPHRAAELDGVRIDPDRLALPERDPLVVEPAGGLLVPRARNLL